MNTAANDNRKYESFLRYGRICEYYFGLGFSIIETSELLNINRVTVSKAIELYLKKPTESMRIQSKANWIRPHQYCTILDFETGIYYENCAELARALNRSHKTVHNWVKGIRNGYKHRFVQV